MKRLLALMLFTLNFSFAFCQDSTAYEKGVTRAENGNFEDALVYFNQAIEQNPQDLYAIYNRGLVNSFLKKYGAAIDDFTSCINIDNNYVNAYLSRGITKRRLADYAGAQDDFKKAIIKKPNFAEAYYHRGYIFEMLGKKDSACYFYNAASGFGMKDLNTEIEICGSPDRNFKIHIARLAKYAESDKYGFSENNPVKVGGSPTNQKEYLSLLRDLNGNPVHFSRAGSCCPYKLESAPLGMAMLDRYLVTYKDGNGKDKTVSVYITFYEYEEPMILKGFKTIEGK